MRDVEASGVDARCDHDVVHLILKVLDEALAVNLVLTAMKHDRLVANTVQLLE